jgi:two-component system nitrogen regulation response regulator NtrX
LDGGDMENCDVKILVLDDEQSIIDIISTPLESEGYVVCKTTQAKEAIQMFIREEPDICILDILMDNKEIVGIVVLKESKARDNAAIFVMVSRLTDDKSREQCSMLGAFDYLEKPINIEELVDTIKDIKEEVRLRRLGPKN